MSDFKYKEIREIEISANNKLVNYINKIIKYQDVLNAIDFPFPDFGEDKYNLAFSDWISTDYIHKDGRSFIDKFLLDALNKLNSKEKQVLRERNQSNISLFEIIFSDDTYIKVLDLLQNKTYDLLSPDLAHVLAIGDLIFARTGELLGHQVFLGSISYLPPSMKSQFIEEVFINFNLIRGKDSNLEIMDYLKKYSINVYRIYTNCIYEAMELNEDIVSIFYEELDEFEFYLQKKLPRQAIRRYLSNLMEFFEYYLADDDLSLYDVDIIDFHEFFVDAIGDGFIISQEDLNSYISTLKSFVKFLSKKDPDYKEKYLELLEISQKRFDYMNRLNLVKLPFKINKKISDLVGEELNNDYLPLITDFDKFILYILDRPLDLTSKNKHIKRAYLNELNQIFESSTYVDKKAPNQKDYGLIDLFYNFALDLDLVTTDDHVLNVSKKGSNFLRLTEEDKYSLVFQYIWARDFMKDPFKRNLEDLLSSLEVNKSYNMASILKDNPIDPKIFFEAYEYLRFLGIINCSLYPNYEIMVTSLGKALGNYLKLSREKSYHENIIELNKYRKKNNI